MTARAAALALTMLTAGVATAADSDFTFTVSKFAIDEDGMECTSACVLRFKGPLRFSIGNAFPLATTERTSNVRYFVGGSKFEVGVMSEMTFLPDGFVHVKAEEIRMTKVPLDGYPPSTK